MSLAKLYSFNQLPYDIIEKIFQQLPVLDRIRLKQVCCLWRDWSKMTNDFLRNQKSLCYQWDPECCSLFNECGNFGEILKSGNRRSVGDKFINLFQKCEKLQFLSFNQFERGVTQKILQLIIDYCPNLRGIDFSKSNVLKLRKCQN